MSLCLCADVELCFGTLYHVDGGVSPRLLQSFTYQRLNKTQIHYKEQVWRKFQIVGQSHVTHIPAGKSEDIFIYEF